LIDTKELADLIDRLPLKPIEHCFLKKRWLHQVGHWDQYSDKTYKRYKFLRGTVVLIGVLIPALASLNFEGDADFWRRGAIIVFSLVVAACVAWEGVQNNTETWRLKRRAADLLLAEGWLFFQGSGEYKAGHKESYPLFVTRTEEIIGRALEDYLALTRDKDQRDKDQRERDRDRGAEAALSQV
jgi:hypothetical protein